MGSRDRRDFLRGLASVGVAAGAATRLAAQPDQALLEIDAAVSDAATLGREGGIDRRELGATGRHVGIYGLGLGSVFLGAVAKQPERADQLLAHALDDLGINYWDTSNDYIGKGAADEQVYSESLVARSLAGRRSRVFLSSKTNARDYDGFLRTFEQSLERLGTDYLDSYSVHALDAKDDLDQIEAGAARAARELKEQKVLRNWGISGHAGGGLLLRAAQRLQPDSITCPYPAGRPDSTVEDELLPYLVQQQIAAVAIKPLRGAKAAGLTAAELVRYTLSLPGMGVVLVGADSVEHIDELAALATGFEAQPAAERAAVSARVQLALSFEAQTPWLRSGYVDGRMV